MNNELKNLLDEFFTTKGKRAQNIILKKFEKKCLELDVKTYKIQSEYLEKKMADEAIEKIIKG